MGKFCQETPKLSQITNTSNKQPKWAGRLINIPQCNGKNNVWHLQKNTGVTSRNEVQRLTWTVQDQTHVDEKWMANNLNTGKCSDCQYSRLSSSQEALFTGQKMLKTRELDQINKKYIMFGWVSAWASTVIRSSFRVFNETDLHPVIMI